MVLVSFRTRRVERLAVLAGFACAAWQVLRFAEVALHSVDLRALQARLGFAEANIATQRGALRLTSDRSRAGLVGDLDARQAVAP